MSVLRKAGASLYLTTWALRSYWRAILGSMPCSEAYEQWARRQDWLFRQHRVTCCQARLSASLAPAAALEREQDVLQADSEPPAVLCKRRGILHYWPQEGHKHSARVAVNAVRHALDACTVPSSPIGLMGGMAARKATYNSNSSPLQNTAEKGRLRMRHLRAGPGAGCCPC